MAEVLELIEKTEKKHYRNLSLEIEGEFSKVHLPSHNLEHHKRVWHYAKELLKSYSVSGIWFSYEFIEALMLAVFFHDVGLTRTLNIVHGIESAQLAKSFLVRNPEISNSYGQELLTAIEKHDNKEYLNIAIGQKIAPSIYSILTVADDLDAFGTIGIYRYMEIYYLRGINANIIIEKIKTNLMKRYNFVSNIILFDKELHKKHFRRYKVTLGFLNSFSIKQLEELLLLIADKRNVNEIDSECVFPNSQLKEFLNMINSEVRTMQAFFSNEIN